MAYNNGQHICGCYFTTEVDGRLVRTYLPQVKLESFTTIQGIASRTVLKQTFVNTSKNKPLGEVRYAFPLFQGATLVGLQIKVGEYTIHGLVKGKAEARKTYDEARERGENAGLVEQLPQASDVFTTSISNIPEDSAVEVTITYIQELSHDAEVDGIRLNIPTSIAPRYGSYPGQLMDTTALDVKGGISLTVDINMSDMVPIQKLISPSHPIEVSQGVLSNSPPDATASVSKASVKFSLGTTELLEDFVLQIVAKDVGVPQAILETHPFDPDQRALMTTLVPKFKLKPGKPEIIFIADRSGSMSGNILTLISALQVFLKSIPVGCCFNICSFGSRVEFLWPKSQPYKQETLDKAVRYVNKFGADFGGTETLQALKASFKIRDRHLPLELMLLTDGDIWSQADLFSYLEDETKAGDARVFPIGIGGGVSSSLIDGVAKAGRGFAQMVGNNEKLDNKIVRMLKGALTPHISNYRLEVRYEDESVDSVADALSLTLHIGASEDASGEQPRLRRSQRQKKPISLYDPDVKDEAIPLDGAELRALPNVDRPRIMQTPTQIPALFPFNRTTVYLLMSPKSAALNPKSVVLKATCAEGPLELEIPVETRKTPDEMIHQLAARKATQELEQGRGWIIGAQTTTGELIKDAFPTEFDALVEREAIRLGVEFQIGGQHCSFVAVEANEQEILRRKKQALDRAMSRKGASDSDGDDSWEMLETAELDDVAARAAVSSWGYGEEKEESDDEMGFGLFDGDGGPIAAQTSLIDYSDEELDDNREQALEKSLPLFQRIIKSQSFEGSWKLEDLELDAMKIDQDRLPNIGVDTSQLATAIVIQFLKLKMQEEEETWELFVEKAVTWLELSLGDDEAAELLEKAASAITVD